MMNWKECGTGKDQSYYSRICHKVLKNPLKRTARLQAKIRISEIMLHAVKHELTTVYEDSLCLLK